MAGRDDMVVPWSEAAEQAVIGAALAWQGAMARITDTGLQAADFFSPAHRDIWEAMLGMSARREAIDVITVYDALVDAGVAEQCGGLEYLNTLHNGGHTLSSAEQYARRVQAKATDRALLEAADRIGELARGPGNIEEKIDAAGALLTTIRPAGAGSAPRSLADHLVERIDHWQALAEGRVHAGIPTGLPHLDRALGGGLKRGSSFVIGARPSVGKTSLATAIALQAAADGHTALLLSQEMMAGDVVDRVAASLGRLPLDAIVTGALTDDQEHRRADAIELASRLPLVIDETPALTLSAIRSKARQVLQQRGKLDLVVLDYLQLAKDDSKAQHRHHQIEQLSRGMKALAKELNCAVIVLSQINRQSTQRTEGEPTLADLKESGAIEEDADVVLLLHPRDLLSDGRMLVVGILAKNRQGRRGRLALAFDGANQRWEASPADVSPRRGGGAA